MYTLAYTPSIGHGHLSRGFPSFLVPEKRAAQFPIHSASASPRVDSPLRIRIQRVGQAFRCGRANINFDSRKPGAPHLRAPLRTETSLGR
jgi:hypothetical protein